MNRITILAGAMAAAFALSSAWAQQAPGVRVVGKVVGVDGPTQTIKRQV